MLTALEMPDPSLEDPGRGDLRDRNRRLLRVLLGIVVALVIGAFLIGIRW